VSFSHIGSLPLEDCLKELGGRFEGGADWQPYAVQDGNLITGQNRQSSELVARHVLDALRPEGLAQRREGAAPHAG
jgi:putative intracellular protease/amidase